MFDISNRCEGNGLTSPAQDPSDVGSLTKVLEEAGPDRQEGHIRYTLVDPETLTLSEIASKSGFWMPEKEFEQVRTSIKEGGQAVPVVVRRTPEGAEIIDGRVRVKICKLLKIAVKVIYVEGTDEEMETLSDQLNERRKHVTQFQRAAKAAQDYFDAYGDQQRGRGRHRNSPGVREFPTQAAFAKSAGVSLSYFELALRILKEEPEEFEKVLSGDLSLEKASKSFPPTSHVKSGTQSVSSSQSPKGKKDNGNGGPKGKKGETEDTVSAKPQEEDKDHQQVNVKQDSPTNPIGNAAPSTEPAAPAPPIEDRENSEPGQVEVPRPPEPIMVDAGTLSSDEEEDKPDIDEDPAPNGEFFSKALGFKRLTRHERIKTSNVLFRWILPNYVRWHPEDEQPLIANAATPLCNLLGIDLT